MFDGKDPEREVAEQPNVVKRLLPFYLRHDHKNTWLYKQTYYDDPEGENLFGKLVATNKLAILPGIFMTLADINLRTKVTDYQRVCGRFIYWTQPCVTAASFFTITTYAAARMRQKDDG